MRKIFFVLFMLLSAVVILSSSAIAEEKSPRQPAAPGGLKIIELLVSVNIEGNQVEAWGAWTEEKSVKDNNARIKNPHKRFVNMATVVVRIEEALSKMPKGAKVEYIIIK